MSSRPVDLARVRAALLELDALMEERPALGSMDARRRLAIALEFDRRAEPTSSLITHGRAPARHGVATNGLDAEGKERDRG